MNDTTLSLPASTDTPAVPTTHVWSLTRRILLLTLLCLVTATSLMDRQLVAILIMPIKHEFGASDTQMGLLTGLAFASVYVVAGFPLGIWADTGRRRSVIAVSLGLWSAMTMLCGATHTFVQLIIARMGVALGEAGCNPAAHSQIADLFSPRGRARAMGFYNASGALGLSFGIFVGGTLISHFDWRTVFLIVGAPGLLLALFVRFVAPEPVRGMSDARPVGVDAPAPLRERLRHLARVRSFRYITLSAMACAFVNYGFASWAAAFFMRVHHLSAPAVAGKLAVASALGLLVGTIGSGLLVDRCSRNDLRWSMRIAGGAMLCALPCGALCLLTSSVNVAFVAYAFTMCLSASWATPLYALTQTVSPTRTRGLASAVVAFFLNVGGYGFGPFAVGALSDRLTPLFGAAGLRYALLALLATSVGAAWLCFATNRHLHDDCETVVETAHN